MWEMLIKLAPSILGFLGTIISVFFVTRGWYESHKLTINREIEAKRREQHLDYLVQTYRTLSKVKPYGDADNLSELLPELQGAIADIQFLGSAEQVEYAQQFAQAWKGGQYNLDPLLKSLRDELRAALGKKEIEGNIWWISIVKRTGNITLWNNDYRSGN